MMRNGLFLLIAVLALLCAAFARGDDFTGRVGAGGTLGAAIPIETDRFSPGVPGVGVGVVPSVSYDPGLSGGGWLAYGLSPRFTARLAYDNHDFEGGPGSVGALMIGGAYHFRPENEWNPTLRFGLGPTWPHDIAGSGDEPPALFGLTAGLGVEKFLTQDVAVGAAFDWLGIPSSGPLRRDVHVLRPGISVGYWFAAPPPPHAH